MSGSTVPELILFSPGEGVITAPWLNTTVQGGCLLANLRAFAGIQNMTVWMNGYNAAGDGGQGMFYWNGSGAGVDDGGVTTIVPYGVTVGFWERISGQISASTILSVANIAALRALTAQASLVFVEGYSLLADGGEGWFALSTSTAADNGGTIIVDATGRRWYREYNGTALNVCWFGATQGLTTDSSPAFSAALAVGSDIYVPSGTFSLASTVSYTFVSATTSLVICGAGSLETILVWPTAASGLSITFAGPLNSIHIRDMTLAAGQSPSTGAAISLTQMAPLGSQNAAEQSDISNVNIRGSDGANLTNYWSTGVLVNGVSEINFFNVKIDGQKIGSAYTLVGTGVSLFGSATIIPVIYNFAMCNFTYLGSGISYGPYVQGVTVSQCNFTGGTTGIYAPPSATGTVLAELAVSASQFNCADYGIYTPAAIAGIMVVNSYFYELGANAAGIYLPVTESFCIMGCTFNGPGGTNTAVGIQVGTNPASLPGTIVGNSIFRHNAGIILGAGSTLINVQSNAYTANVTNVINNGTGNTVGGGSQ